MPGSSEYLQELLSRVLGDELMKGLVTLIADDMYIGGDSIDERLFNWSRLPSATKNLCSPHARNTAFQKNEKY